MDDITRKHLDGLEERLGARIEGVKQDLTARLETVARGLDATITASVAAGFQAASEERRVLHGETARAFQAVIDEAARIGAATAINRRIAELEARLAKIEAALQQS